MLAQPSLLVPAFEVASVHLNNSGSPVSRTQIDGNRLTISNIALRDCIEWAYEMRAYQIVSAPNWLGDVRLDISAKAPDNTPQESFI